MKEVYYILSHGMVQSSEVLTHKERFGIPVISIGTEGELSYIGPTLFLVNYFMKIHGNLFMNKLLRILLQYGDKYNNEFKPDKSKIEQDIRFLFDINKREVKIYPSNMLRAYYGAHATLLNTGVCINKPNENLLGSLIIFNDKNNVRVNIAELITKKYGKYKLDEFTIYNQDKVITLTHPFGIFKFNEINRSFDIKYKFKTTDFIYTREMLEEIHKDSTKQPIVFMIHCKAPNKQIMMDFNFKKYPIEKGYTKALEDLMATLSIKQTPQQMRATKKRKPSPPKETITHKRPKLAPTQIIIKPTPNKKIKPTPQTATPKR